MKLYITRVSPFARKCRILARELNLSDRIEEIEVDVWDKSQIRPANPLGKVPALQPDNGITLVDSPVICEYLDHLGGDHFFPSLSRPTERWRALTLQALADGLSDALVNIMVEQQLRPAEKCMQAMVQHHLASVVATLDVLEKMAIDFPEEPTIGEVATACALSICDPLAKATPWRDDRPVLAAWFETFSERESFCQTHS